MEPGIGPQNEQDHFDRLAAMSQDNGVKWDLSDDDKAAIAWAVKTMQAFMYPAPFPRPSDCKHQGKTRESQCWRVKVCSECGAVIGDLENFARFISEGIEKGYPLRFLAEKFHHELSE